MPIAEFANTRIGIAPRGYSPGRPFGRCIWVVIHTTDGSEEYGAALNGNHYDSVRTDSVSTHVFVDADIVVQELNSWDRAWAARETANNLGYHVEICGRASQSVAQWSDKSSAAEVLIAAQHVARVCLKLGIPPRWASKTQVQARLPGIITHANVSAWLEGTHTDPGPNFPYVPFISQVQFWYDVYAKPAPTPPKPPATIGDNDMKLFKTADAPAYYKTDGVYAWHLETMAEVARLEKLFGSTVVLDEFPTTVHLASDSPAAFAAAAPIEDEGIKGEHP